MNSRTVGAASCSESVTFDAIFGLRSGIVCAVAIVSGIAAAYAPSAHIHPVSTDASLFPSESDVVVSPIVNSARTRSESRARLPTASPSAMRVAYVSSRVTTDATMRGIGP
jgi:hypothetical protein